MDIELVNASLRIKKLRISENRNHVSKIIRRFKKHNTSILWIIKQNPSFLQD